MCDIKLSDDIIVGKKLVGTLDLPIIPLRVSVLEEVHKLMTLIYGSGTIIKTNYENSKMRIFINNME